MKKSFIGSEYTLNNLGLLIKKPKKTLENLLNDASGGKVYKTLESLIKDVKLVLRKK